MGFEMSPHLMAEFLMALCLLGPCVCVEGELQVPNPFVDPMMPSELWPRARHYDLRVRFVPLPRGV
jgi:hypothetical protein